MKTLGSLAVEDPKAFAALVGRLRELGVRKLDDLELGDPPRAHVPLEREPVSPEEALRRRYDVMFAATSMRPPMPKQDPSTNGVPRAVVQREKRQARHGDDKP